MEVANIMLANRSCNVHTTNDIHFDGLAGSDTVRLIYYACQYHTIGQTAKWIALMKSTNRWPKTGRSKSNTQGELVCFKNKVNRLKGTEIKLKPNQENRPVLELMVTGVSPGHCRTDCWYNFLSFSDKQRPLENAFKTGKLLRNLTCFYNWRRPYSRGHCVLHSKLKREIDVLTI